MALRYGVRDLPRLLRTPLGRAELRRGATHLSWPVLKPVARLYRAGPARRVRLVAVTGSYGKTTTTRAAAAALGHDPDDRPVHNYMSWLALGVLRARPGERHRALEVGIDRPGQMSRYARLLRPDVAVVTSIGSEHNGSLPDLSVTRAEKAELVRALPRDGHAVLNGDDENVRWMATQTDARITYFGFGDDNDVRATDVELDWPEGTAFTVHADGEARRARVRLIGRPMVLTALAGIAVALGEGEPLDAVLARLAELPPTPGRLQPVALPSGAHLLRDDYKAGLETIDSALDVFAEVPGRRVVVLGDLEEAPEALAGLYARLGDRVAAIADRAIFVQHHADGPRYADSARAGGLAPDAVVDARGGWAEAAEAAAAGLGPGDVVLVKGGITQRLDRVSLALAGRAVRCRLPACAIQARRCERCQMLERGWRPRELLT